MLQGQVHCSACDKDVYAVVQPSTGGDVLAGGNGEVRMVRKCASCRAPLPPVNAPTNGASTSPEMAMPAAAVLVPEQPPPRRSPPRHVAVAPQAAPRAPVPALLVPSHDYAAMMREEMAALDAAEQQIRERRVYLQRMIAMLEPQAAEAADEAA